MVRAVLLGSRIAAARHERGGKAFCQQKNFASEAAWNKQAIAALTGGNE